MQQRCWTQRAPCKRLRSLDEHLKHPPLILAVR